MSLLFQWILSFISVWIILSLFCRNAKAEIAPNKSGKKSVIVSLDARWKETSFLAETSEFLANEGNQVFWDFISKIVDNAKPNQLKTFTDQQIHEFCLKQAADLISPARLDLLKFALSLRSHSPAVHVHRQLASEYEIEESCKAFIDVEGRVTCKISDIENLLDNVTSFGITEDGSGEIYSTDHVFPGAKRAKIKAILYGDLGDGDWLAFHLALKGLAKNQKIKYILRHFDRSNNDKTKVRLSGYGVELSIKSTEYKAQDDSKITTKVTDDGAVIEEEEEEEDDLNGLNIRLLKQLHPELKEQLQQFKLHLLEADELTPLKVWQTQDLAFQAAQRIVLAESGDALQTLIDISQNFPLMARSLARQRVEKNFKEEIRNNQEQTFEDLGVNAGDSALFINGILVDLETLDVYQLLDMLKKEEKLSAGFFRMGFRREYLSILMDLDMSEDGGITYAIDFRDGYPEYLNNLDVDPQYRGWGNSLKLMLQPYFPGMIRPIARNFFTLIFIVDPSTRQSRNLLKIAHSFYNHEIPIRIGIIFAVNPDKTVAGFEDAGVALLNLYNFIKTDKKPTKALKALIQIFDDVPERDALTASDVVNFFKKQYRDEDEDMVFGPDSDYDKGRQAGAQFLEKSGLGKAPKVLLNGIPLDDSGVAADRFEETVINQIMKITPKIQKAIMEGRLTDKENVMNWLMDQSDVMPRLNRRVLEAGKAAGAKYLDLTDVMEYKADTVSQFARLTERRKNQFMLQTMKHLTRSQDLMTRPVTVWVVGDMDTVEGRDLYYNAIKTLKHSHNLRVGLVHNPLDPEKEAPNAGLIQAALKLLPDPICKQLVTKLVKEENSDRFVLEELAPHGMDLDGFQKERKMMSGEFLKIHSRYATRTLDLVPGQRAIVANGLLIGPFEEKEKFEVDDYNLLEKYMLGRCGQVVAEHIDKWQVDKSNDKSSDVVLRAAALVSDHPIGKRRHWVVLQADEHSTITMPAQDETTAAFDIVAILDPLSRDAQKLAPVLGVIRKVVNADLKVVMNPKPKLSELPLKRFYRFVLDSALEFGAEGNLRRGPFGRFGSLPRRQLLTLNVHVPEAWLVQPVTALHDLDNIRMDLVEGDVKAEFELEYLLLEGHSFDEVTGAPPRGLQFTLGTQKQPIQVDTIVMANLGYFQLKASPGAWVLRLREGRSKDIYDITTHTNTESTENDVTVLLDSFTGKTVRIRVAKKANMTEENVLTDSKEAVEDDDSLWSSMYSSFGRKESSDGGGSHDVINIFSLASGHLYERFMRIMILSVMKHTKSPVKFWLLKNYLSPQFKKFLPFMAEKYGFQYEYVQYKWPRWLHQQTEKHRVMWGYKILFLDVLFPLDVRKIIFVDADQVVRADMMELMDFDLDGAPYGFTPFCDSRKEMDGFRFWKRGYWVNHLAGRRYHISALYVIDLKKFRQMAAGDRLRGQYQGLSSDPNSLSNLDQDLPNNMIHQVRIKSLPQEWLWCETWCDDRSKNYAKTIDLCNNPQTKEPKLDSAIRIIDEWRQYDEEIKQLIRERDDEQMADSAEQPKDTVQPQHKGQDLHGEL